MRMAPARAWVPVRELARARVWVPARELVQVLALVQLQVPPLERFWVLRRGLVPEQALVSVQGRVPPQERARALRPEPVLRLHGRSL